MASANVTLGRAYEFEADGTERVATLNYRGGWVRCVHATVGAFINIEGSAVTTTQPAGTGHLYLPPATHEWTPLPADCGVFNFKATASTNIQYVKAP